MINKYYITTPIYYPSAKPHMGHAYSNIVSDVLARFKRMENFDVMFLTGTDEHGLKIQKASEREKMVTQDFCDKISKNFFNLTKLLNLSNNDFIRTTENRHKATVAKIWQLLFDKKQIYLSKYSGWYSVSDEAYYSDDDVYDHDGKKFSKISDSLVTWMEEDSYFFKLSDWQKPLLDFYEKNIEFILPESRRNEVISFVSNGLKDLSISRTTFNWGIEVPNDPKHIIYVWLDALTNYISATNYFLNHNGFWPASVHIIGKDILRFHAVYWPAFLMAADLPLPKQIFGHGWILSGDHKMSKSKGNILDPVELVDEFGSDEVRYYLLKEVIFGQDGKINICSLKISINDLANNIGNLSNRIFSILDKDYECLVPMVSSNLAIENELSIKTQHFSDLMNKFELHNYTKDIHTYSTIVNKFVNDKQPWNKKINTKEDINNILYSSLHALKNIFILLYPIMPKISTEFLKNLNISENNIKLTLINERLKPGSKLTKPSILFNKYK